MVIHIFITVRRKAFVITMFCHCFAISFADSRHHPQIQITKPGQLLLQLLTLLNQIILQLPHVDLDSSQDSRLSGRYFVASSTPAEGMRQPNNWMDDSASRISEVQISYSYRRISIKPSLSSKPLQFSFSVRKPINLFSYIHDKDEALGDLRILLMRKLIELVIYQVHSNCLGRFVISMERRYIAPKQNITQIVNFWNLDLLPQDQLQTRNANVPLIPVCKNRYRLLQKLRFLLTDFY